MYTKIENCRLCGSDGLTEMVDLGEQYLTGVFPKDQNAELTRGPLVLAFCDNCHLVQLLHSYDLTELYGAHYGYRSGLNRSMVEHLQAKVASLERLVSIEDDDVILDIGSNDGTLLSFYPEKRNQLVGIDPSADKFRQYYRDDIQLIIDFFSAQRFLDELGTKTRAKVVTSIAMFYDLEAPLDFMQQIESILAADGIWHFEQSYMPFMLKTNEYDTICHEHLEYYALEQIKWMTERAGLKIIDVEFNQVNGGSFALTVAKQASPYKECRSRIARILQDEAKMQLNTLVPYQSFKDRIYQHREELLFKLNSIASAGELILGYGASTKGNVILQFCGIDKHMLSCIAEVNEDKFGCHTPGTGIPIVSEAEAKNRKPDYFMVLPWHFKENLVAREHEFLQNGGKMLFPLPRIEVV